MPASPYSSIQLVLAPPDDRAARNSTSGYFPPLGLPPGSHQVGERLRSPDSSERIRVNPESSIPSSSEMQPGTYARHSCLEPYGLECIAAVLLESGLPVQLRSAYSRNNRRVYYLDVASRLLLFSSFTSDHAEVVSVAAHLKRERRGTTVILGGHHASGMKALAAIPPVDYVVVGEGEDTVSELATALLGGSAVQGNVLGTITGKDRNGFITRPRIQNLDRLPLPIRRKELLGVSRIHALSFPAPSAQTGAAQISYSRGCPFSCPYCASPQTWGRSVRWRDPMHVAREARILAEQYDVNMLLFTDLAFNHREDRVIALCDQMDAQRLEINWHAMCAFTGTSPATLQRMAASGCSKIGWGIEALTTTSLSNLDARQCFDTIKTTLKAADSVGIINRAYLMIGYPWQTRAELEENLTLLSSLPVDELSVTFYTPFPGTPAFDKYRSRLCTEDLSLFDTEHPVLNAADMTVPDLIEARKSLVARFYASPSYDQRRSQKTRRFPRLKRSYDELFNFLHSRAVLG